MTACVLCEPQNETVLWQDRRSRIVLSGDLDYPAYCKVIWNAHVREMTDLTKSQRARYLNVVYTVEQALRRLLKPEKINLASLGNSVPHLHWHVIPRFIDDTHFPYSIWDTRRRTGSPHAIDQAALVQALFDTLGGRRHKPHTDK